jgi:DNA-binding Xre family transcriptional regulator
LEIKALIKSNLRYIMRKKGISLRKLAFESGVAESTLQKVRESVSIRNCKLSTLENIAKTLGCKISDLFEEEKG